MIIFKRAFSFLLMVFSGVIAVKLTFPLLLSWFGITITVTGATPIVGMYMYLLTTFVVGAGILLAIGGVVLVGFGVAYVIAALMDFYQSKK